MKYISTFFVAGALWCFATAAHAWNATGHEVVARIAWDNMTPKARQLAISLLEAAPADAGLSQLHVRTQYAANRAFFMRAATWPDIVRDQKFPQRREKYHRGNWHYINYFWEENGPNRTRERTDLKPEVPNIVERLQALTTELKNSRDASTRSIHLAWILHLVGDVHQPLHTSARVTKLEPRSDRGGNDFKLAGQPGNLHAYWDDILDLQIPRRASEREDAYINRVAGIVVAQHPKSKYSQALQKRDFNLWAREGFLTSRRSVYRGTARGQKPSAAYRGRAFEHASRAVALAGYRLADVLNAAFE